jgi:hypothetical protein
VAVDFVLKRKHVRANKSQWARKVRLFVFDEDPPGDIESLEDDSDALRLIWKNWARVEEKKRYHFSSLQS